jgi:O-antigen/teichoic acid export membrane protein
LLFAMSRLKHFGQSLISGYLLLGANTLYTLASVRLALAYLPVKEFGLWALASQVAAYIAFIDMGMSNAVSRILMDHKDDRAGGSYGSVIQTGALVGAVQGLLIILAGTGLAFFAVRWFGLTARLQAEFFWLLAGQSVLLGVQFATRILNYLFVTHQRYDIPNYTQSVLFGVNLLVMWAGFAAGLGVYSFLAAQAVVTLLGAAVSLAYCLRLGFFPAAGGWGRVSAKQFRELFSFGGDVFLMGIGWQFISASQTILLTRFLGLDTAAVWTVCTRTYTMLTLVVWRIFDFSSAALTEMMVRREQGRLESRFREITVVSAGVALLCGTGFALGNQPFILLWTKGAIHWAPVNDLLLAAWFCLVTLSRMHLALATQTKQFGFLRYVLLVEGLVFLGLNAGLRELGGVTRMLGLSLACTLAFSLPYGLRRTAAYFQRPARELAAWYRPTWSLAWRLVPVAAGTGWFIRGWPPLWQLAALLWLGLFGALVLFRNGVSPALRTEIVARLPGWAGRRFAQRLC